MTGGSRGTASAHDGFPLAVTHYAAPRPWATLVFANAMGVRQEFYAPLARFLAGEGIEVHTFDYRGTFASRREKLAGFACDLMTWATQDLDAMVARAAASGLPVFYLGHSLGGQLLGVLPSNASVRAAITVTAGSGWYRYNDRMPLQVRLFWFAAIPSLTPLFGYFPGRALRMVGDLPAGVARQWRRWALHPDYIHSESPALAASFARVRAPIAGYSFEDDAIITRVAIDDLHRRYTQAAVERHHLHPRDLGRSRVGHFGFFAEASRDTLWRGMLLELRDAVGADNVEPRSGAPAATGPHAARATP